MDFNPRSHERSDSLTLILLENTHLFQSTLPREERRYCNSVNKICINFNPRSHERSDDYCENNPNHIIISIHAPTRGATKGSEQQQLALQFQSTLPREERPQQPWHLQQHRYFNPRSHERSDEGSQRITRAASNISIHAPTRGATERNHPDSNAIRFQSTLPREERQQYCTKNLFIFIQYRQ